MKALLLFVCLLATDGRCQAPPRAATPAQIAANQAYDAAKARHLAERGDSELMWQFGRACFDCAENAPNDIDRAPVAKEGMAVCRQAIDLTNSAPAHYYLGLNMAELARTKSFGGLHLLHEMEREWMLALSVDRSFDYAGPDRSLGLLFRDAPSPPLSVGSRTKSLYHLQHALELAPQFPENHLNLIETEVKWHKLDDARKELTQWLKVLPDERKEFSGSQWQWDWQDWDARAAKIQARLFKPSRRSGR